MAAKTPKQTEVVVTGTNLRMQTAKSKRGQHTTFETMQDLNPANGFVDFLREHAIVGLAIGFVVGAQMQILVKSLIGSFIDPMFQLLFGEALSQRAFTLHFHGRSAGFSWGAFVYALMNFVFVLLIIYLVVKYLKLDKLDKPTEELKGSSNHD